MSVLEGITLAAVLGLSIGISLVIAVPLTGAIVRLRANYNPKGLQLDPEGNVEPHTGPVVTSFFGMLKRVKRIEGWSGLYKGLMPTLLATLTLTIFAVVALNSTSASYHGRVNPPAAGPFGVLAYGLFSMFVSLPATIITYRSITTPYKLPYFRPIYSLRVLLTPTERQRPWILYLTPGLLLTQTLHVVLTAFVLRSLSSVLVPRGEDVHLNVVKFSIYLAAEMLSIIVLCPLEVVATKLAIQRNHAAPEYNSVEQEVEDDAIDAQGYTEYSGVDEDVIGLRHEKDPYLGLVDCAKRVADEEGWTALYRAWWLTMLGGIGHAAASVAPGA